MSGRKLKAISTRPSQPLVEGRVENAPLTPNTVARSATESISLGILHSNRQIARISGVFDELSIIHSNA